MRIENGRGQILGELEEPPNSAIVCVYLPKLWLVVNYSC